MESFNDFMKFAFFSRDGRINRAVYILGMSILSLIVTSAYFITDFSLLSAQTPTKFTGLATIAYISITIVYLYALFNLALKRAYDVNRDVKTAVLVTFNTVILLFGAFIAIAISAISTNLIFVFLAIGAFIAVFSFYLSAILLCVKSKGENEHGPSALDNPELKKYSSVGVIIWIVIINIGLSFYTGSVISDLEDKKVEQAYNECLTDWNAEREKIKDYYKLDSKKRDSAIEEYSQGACTSKVSYIEDEDKLDRLARRVKESIKSSEVKLVDEEVLKKAIQAEKKANHETLKQVKEEMASIK